MGERQGSAGGDEAGAVSACCAPAAQVSCCEPAAKADCCGADASGSGGCGCSEGAATGGSPAAVAPEVVAEAEEVEEPAEVHTLEPVAGTAPLPVVVVIGGGPVGLAAAAHLLERGLEPLVLEAGDRVGAAVAEWGHVSLFSPWAYTVDAAAGRLLDRTGGPVRIRTRCPPAGNWWGGT